MDSSDSFIILDMPNLINLAIGKHSLNINLLRAILHLIVSQMNLKSLKIQLPIDENLQISQSDVNNIEPNPEDLFIIYNVFDPPKGEFNPKECTLKPVRIDSNAEVNKLIILKDNQYLPLNLSDNNEKKKSETIALEGFSTDDVTKLQIVDMLSLTFRLNQIEKHMKKGKRKRSNVSLLPSSAAQSSILKKTDSGSTKILQNQSSASNSEQQDSKIIQHDLMISEHEIGFKALKDEIENIKTDLDQLLSQKQEMDDRIVQLIESDKKQNEQIHIIREEICSLEKHRGNAKSQMTQIFKFLDTAKYQFKKIFLSLAPLNAAFNNQEVFLQAVFADNKELNNRVDTLNEAIELVKCTKSDKVSVEEEFEKKASKEDIENLVDMDYFQHVKRDLSRGLIDALEKILESDVGWHKSIEDIYYRLDNSKLDRNEFAANCLITSSKLTTLKEKIRQISMFRINCESAATQEKYIKDVKCISCNAQSYMRSKITDPVVPKLSEMPKRSRKKFVKLAHISVVPCKPKIQLIEPKMVTRYCGGENTKTTASERLSKKGNFLEDNKGAIPSSNVSVEYEQGTDGKLYRVDKRNCD